MFNMYFIWY